MRTITRSGSTSSLVMFRYPHRTPVVDLLAWLFTLTKWSLLGVSFLLLSLGIVVAAWRWRTGRTRARRPGLGRREP
jgi:membrane protein implicated in regulation of membrane protease activity